MLFPPRPLYPLPTSWKNSKNQPLDRTSFCGGLKKIVGEEPLKSGDCIGWVSSPIFHFGPPPNAVMSDITSFVTLPPLMTTTIFECEDMFP